MTTVNIDGEEIPQSVWVKSLEDIMSGAFLDYAMSVIISRALPDVRDGMKPVHRRIIYAMSDGFGPNARPAKSARVVGNVIGKYHPHGDQSVYMAMVRMAQPFTMRNELIFMQGNYGSVDGDMPAAMRYTESKMSKIGGELIRDLDKNIVPFQSNYDESDFEPKVLPARFPHLLVNGQIGIAVGMATNIPTHNIVESINACFVVMDNPNATIDDILAVMPGPDFPTYGVILGRRGIRDYYATGSGSVIMSGVAAVEENRGRERIVITEIPYLVNKETMVKKIHDIARDPNDTRFAGISEIRDESGRQGMRIVVEVKQDADATVVLQALRKFSEFQTPFPVNMTCIDTQGKPRQMSILEVLSEFVAFRRDTVRKRSQNELDKNRAKQIVAIGLYVAVSKLDEVISIIRNAPDRDTARASLMALEFGVDDTLAQMIRESDPDEVPGSVFRLSLVQTNALLEMKLGQLTAVDRDEQVAEVYALQNEIKVLLEILLNPTALDNVARNEMLEIREKFGDARRTVIEDSEADDIDDDALVERKPMIVTLTNTGYVKRTDLSVYRAQKRGGKGRKGMETKDDDYVVQTIVATTRTPLLVFTERGMVFSTKCWRLPEAAANAKGRPIVNVLPNIQGDRVTSIVALPEEREEFENKSLVFVTRGAKIRRNKASDFLDIRKTGKIAMKLVGDDGVATDTLVDVLLADDDQDVLVATAKAACIRYPVDTVRLFVGRDSVGVRAIGLKDGDHVVSATLLKHSDAESIERTVYLGAGESYMKAADLLDAEGKSRALPVGLAHEPAATDESPDRVKVTMSSARFEELKAVESHLLTISELGYGKRSSSHEYRVVAGRGGSGITAANIDAKTGDLVACMPVSDDDGLVIVTDGGMTIRTRVSDIRIIGRSSRGVSVLDVPAGQKITSVARVPAEEDDDDVGAGADDNEIPSNSLNPFAIGSSDSMTELTEMVTSLMDAAEAPGEGHAEPEIEAQEEETTEE